MIIPILGFFGMFLILLAFIMEDMKRWKHTSIKYAIANTTGSVLLCVYAVYLKSWPFLILNTIWAIVSVRDVIIDMGKKKK